MRTIYTVRLRIRTDMRRPRTLSKRATNVSVRSELLDAAREAGLNLSATLESALERELAEAKRRTWLPSDLLQDLQTRAVIPLTRAATLAKKPLAHLTPALAFDGQDYVLMTPQLAGIERTDLGAAVGSLANEGQTIIAAMDFLLTGC
jgi:toxin CcdB